MSYTYAGQYGAEQIIDTSGTPQPSTAVTVYETGTNTLATLYTDATKATAASNPVDTDADGNLTFFADPGQYDLGVAGFGTRATVAVTLDPSELGAYMRLVPAPTGVAATDTANLQDALNGGGVVVASAGTYVVNAALTIPNDTCFRGQGRGVTILEADSSLTTYLISEVRAAGSTLVDVTISDMTLDGKSTPAGSLTLVHVDTTAGGTTIDVHNLLLERLELQNALYGFTHISTQGGTALSSVGSLTHECRFYNLAVGVIFGSTYNARIDQCDFVGNTIAAIGASAYQTIPNVGGSGSGADQAWTTITGCHIEGLGNLTGSGSATESGIVFAGAGTIISNTTLSFISQYPIWVQANEQAGTQISSVVICQTGGTIMRLDSAGPSNTTLAGGGIVNNVFASFAVQNPSLGGSGGTEGAAISIDGGDWDLSDIIFSSGGSSGGGEPAAVYALIAGFYHQVGRVRIRNYNCQQHSGSWLAPIGGTSQSANPNLDLEIRECPGFNPFGPIGYNMLSADDSSFESSVGTFTAASNCSIATSTAEALYGTHSLALTSSAAGTMQANCSASAYAVRPNTLVTAYASFRAATTGRSCLIQIAFYTSGGSLVSYPQGPSVTDTTTGWTLATNTAVVPATAAYAQVDLIVQGTGAASEVHYVDGVQLEASPMANTWGLGGTTGVPASGSAANVSFFDEVHYVTAGSGGLSYAITDGDGHSSTSVTVPANAFAAISVPAGSVWTPTYSSAPTLTRYAQ